MYLMKLDDYEMRIEVGFGQDYQVLRPRVNPIML